MGVDSYFELYTTLYGWQLYNIVWSVLTGTGLALVPFVVILIRNFLDVNNSMEANAGSSASVRRMELEIVLALTVIVLAAQPALSLEAFDLSFSPPSTLSNPDPVTVDATDSGTTFGSDTGGFAGAPNSVEVPIWWYGVMSISSGFNRAVIEAFPAQNEMREIERAMRLMYIENPTLRREVNEFYNRCYVPARSKYLEQQPVEATGILADKGQDDPDWMGSHVYRHVPGYYDTLHAGNPVPGFPVDLSRDTDQFWLDSSGTITSGIPYCKEWWEDSEYGIRQRLIDDNSTTKKVWTWIGAQWSGMSREDRLDGLARNILEQTPNTFTRSLGAERFAARGASGAEELMQSTLSSVGLVGFYYLILGPALLLVINALPFIQSLTLMGIFALMPLIIVLAMYRPSILFVGALGIFTVKFWTVLWAIALWVDGNLMNSMFPDGQSFFQALGSQGAHKTILLDLVVFMFYVGLPMILTLMMGWAGFRGMSAIDSFQEKLSGSANKAGASGARFAKIK